MNLIYERYISALRQAVIRSIRFIERVYTPSTSWNQLYVNYNTTCTNHKKFLGTEFLISKFSVRPSFRPFVRLSVLLSVFLSVHPIISQKYRFFLLFIDLESAHFLAIMDDDRPCFYRTSPKIHMENICFSFKKIGKRNFEFTLSPKFGRGVV